MPQSPLKLDLRIDWSELDLFGHVNNVAYFKYIQAARVNYWDVIGLSKMYDERQIGPMLVSCNCQFRQPLYYPGRITVETRMKFIGNTSFGFQHHILNETGDMAAEAEDVMVVFDFYNHEKQAFPVSLRATVEQLEGKSF